MLNALESLTFPGHLLAPYTGGACNVFTLLYMYCMQMSVIIMKCLN